MTSNLDPASHLHQWPDWHDENGQQACACGATRRAGVQAVRARTDKDFYGGVLPADLNALRDPWAAAALSPPGLPADRQSAYKPEAPATSGLVEVERVRDRYRIAVSYAENETDFLWLGEGELLSLRAAIAEALHVPGTCRGNGECTC